MKRKLRIGVSNASPKSRVVTYKKVSPEAKVKDVVGDTSKLAIIVPGDSLLIKFIKYFEETAILKKIFVEETKGHRIWQRNHAIGSPANRGR